MSHGHDIQTTPNITRIYTHTHANTIARHKFDENGLTSGRKIITKFVDRDSIHNTHLTNVWYKTVVLSAINSSWKKTKSSRKVTGGGQTRGEGGRRENNRLTIEREGAVEKGEGRRSILVESSYIVLL